MRSGGPLPLGEVDACLLALLLAVVSGLAALVDAALAALTLSLVALGLGAFLLGVRTRPAGRLRADLPTAFALSLLLLGGVVFFWAPPGTEGMRALFLAFSALPLGWVHHRGLRRSSEGRA